MTVSGNIDKIIYVSPSGPDGRGPYATPPYIDTDDLFVATVSAGTIKRLSHGEDYYLTPYPDAQNGLPSGGELTLAFPEHIPDTAAGRQLVIQLQTDRGQPVELDTEQILDLKTIEQMHDSAALVDMDLRRQLAGAIRLPYGDTMMGLQALPAAASRAGKIPYFCTAQDEAAGRGTTGDLRVITPTELLGIIEGNAEDTRAARLSAGDLGLKGDGSDETEAMRSAIVYWGDRGGAIFDLRPPPNGVFRFTYGIYIDRSNIHLQFSGPPVLLGPSASVWIEGTAVYVYQAPMRLLAPASAGATSIQLDTLALGGAPVNSYIASGARLELRGPTTPAGRPEWQQTVRVLTISGSTVTITPALQRSADAVTTLVYVEAGSTVSVNTATDSNLVTVQNASSFGQEWVEITSATTAGMVAGGSSSALVATELARVERVGLDGPGVLRLHRALSKAYTTAAAAHVTRLRPVYGSSVSGLVPQYLGPADTGLVPAVAVRRAVGCSVAAVTDEHAGDFGHRGPTILVERSAHTLISRINVGPARYTGANEGDGVMLGLGATATRVSSLNVTGARVGLRIAGAMDSTVEGLSVASPGQAGILLDGRGETRTVITAPTVRGGTTYATGVTASYGIQLGSDEHGAGPYDVYIVDAVVEGFTATEGAGIRVMAGASDINISGAEIERCRTGVRGDNSAASPTRQASQISFDGLTLDSIVGWPVDLHGNRYGGGLRALTSVTLRRVRLTNCARGVRLSWLDTVVLVDLDALVGFAGDPAEPYLLDADSCLGLVALRTCQRGGQRGVRLQSCPSALIAFGMHAGLATPYVFADGGGNTNMQWILNVAPGVGNQLLVLGSPSSGVVYWPLAITPTANFRTLP